MQFYTETRFILNTRTLLPTAQAKPRLTANPMAFETRRSATTARCTTSPFTFRLMRCYTTRKSWVSWISVDILVACWVFFMNGAEYNASNYTSNIRAVKINERFTFMSL